MASAQQIQTITIGLRRHQNSTQWGFKMQGGRDQGLPLFIQKVSYLSIYASDHSYNTLKIQIIS